MSVIETSSLQNLISNSVEIAIFGNEACEYKKIEKILGNYYVQRTFNYEVGQQSAYTLAGRDLLEIPSPVDRIDQNAYGEEKVKTAKKISKNALSNLVIENYKRSEEGTPLIPLLFIVDTSDNPFPVPDAEAIFGPNAFVTNSELRRCFKLFALEDEKEETLRKIGSVAKEMIIFVKVNFGNPITFERLENFYNKELWNEAYEARLERRGQNKEGWKGEIVKGLRPFAEERLKYHALMRDLKNTPESVQIPEPFCSRREFMLEACRLYPPSVNFIKRSLLSSEYFLSTLLSEVTFDLNSLIPELFECGSFVCQLMFPRKGNAIMRNLYPLPSQAQKAVKEGTFKDDMLVELKKAGHPLAYAPKSILNNAHFMDLAIATDPFSALFCSEELTADLPFMLKQLSRNEIVITVAAKSVLVHPAFIAELAKREPRTLTLINPS